MANFGTGDDVYTFASTTERLKEWKERVTKVKEEIKGLPEGGRHITFYMTDAYMRNYSPNTKIPYKETITSIRPDGWRKTKTHVVTIRQGRIKTSNAEEIATLDMKVGFVRARDRKLTQREAQQAKIEELEKKVTQLMAEGEKEEPVEIVEPIKKKPGRPKKVEKDKSYASAKTKG